MKNIILFALLFSVATANAQKDDVVVINKPKKVTIITNDSLQKIIVNGKDNDESFVYQSTIQLVDSNYVSITNINKDRWELVPSIKVGQNKDGESGYVITAHFGIGFVSPTKCDERIDVSTFRSWEIFATIAQCDRTVSKNNIVSLGVGIDWKNYRMTNDMRFVKGPDGNVGIEKYPLEVSPKFSRIKVFSVTGTLRYEHDFGKGFALGFGPVVNFNTYASIKTRYKMYGDEHKIVDKHIRQRPITVDWMLNARIADLPVYCKYSNNDVLKDGGLKFRSFSFGLYL